jgi:hypothetical protein
MPVDDHEPPSLSDSRDELVAELYRLAEIMVALPTGEPEDRQRRLAARERMAGILLLLSMDADGKPLI